MTSKIPCRKYPMEEDLVVPCSGGMGPRAWEPKVTPLVFSTPLISGFLLDGRMGRGVVVGRPQCVGGRGSFFTFLKKSNFWGVFCPQSATRPNVAVGFSGEKRTFPVLYEGIKNIKQV